MFIINGIFSFASVDALIAIVKVIVIVIIRGVNGPLHNKLISCFSAWLIWVESTKNDGFSYQLGHSENIYSFLCIHLNIIF